jgi:hypothetical protein
MIDPSIVDLVIGACDEVRHRNDELPAVTIRGEGRKLDFLVACGGISPARRHPLWMT